MLVEQLAGYDLFDRLPHPANPAVDIDFTALYPAAGNGAASGIGAGGDAGFFRKCADRARIRRRCGFCRTAHPQHHDLRPDNYAGSACVVFVSVSAAGPRARWLEKGGETREHEFTSPRSFRRHHRTIIPPVGNYAVQKLCHWLLRLSSGYSPDRRVAVLQKIKDILTKW